MQTHATIRNVDPTARSDDDRSTRTRVSALVFETLTALDPNGRLQTAIATDWDRDGRAMVWRLHLRAGIALHGGGSLQTWQVVTALRTANPRWKLATDGDVLVIELDAPNPDLPWELASARNAIGVRGDGGGLAGTGPFRIERADPKRIALRAHEAYWGGRPFVDAVQIDTAVSATDLLTNLELGRSDMAPVLPTQARRLAQRGLRLVVSRPLTTYALVFEPQRSGADAAPVRRTISAAIDRGALQRVVLQSHGEAATALVPSWLSGFSLSANVTSGSSRARVLTLPVEQRTLTLRIDAGDSLAQAIADRIAVDVREAGLTMNVQAPTGLAPRPDVRLVRIPYDATTPDRALASALTVVGPRAATLATPATAPAPGAAADAVYQVERALLERFVVVPLVHVPDVYAIADRVEGWAGDPVNPTGGWNIANLWLRGDEPPRR
jgi:MarR-like DNA-binding transcriptional regulator SgrR of sgrS sRNA